MRLWSTPLDSDPGPAACWLAPDEVERAHRFSAAEARSRWITGRAALRGVLARELGCEPQQVPIATSPSGKPFAPGRDLTFSVSRAAGLAVIATSRICEVGVDAERIDDRIDWELLAARYLSPAEQSFVLDREATARPAAFLVCWTRKEALLKARGCGIDGEPARVDIPVEGGGPAAVGGWSVQNVGRWPGYAVAVAWGPQAEGEATRFWAQEDV